MPGKYAVSGPLTGSTVADTIIQITGGTAVRPRLSYVLVGNATTPTDSQFEALLKRYTAAGTGGSAVTPEPFEVGDIAAETAGMSAPTTEPTYTGVALLDIPFHMRTTFQWFAKEGWEIIAPATASNGLGLQYQGHASATPALKGTFHFEE